MDIPDYIIERIQSAQVEFKLSINRQIDELFGALLLELKKGASRRPGPPPPPNRFQFSVVMPASRPLIDVTSTPIVTSNKTTNAETRRPSTGIRLQVTTAATATPNNIVQVEAPQAPPPPPPVCIKTEPSIKDEPPEEPEIELINPDKDTTAYHESSVDNFEECQSDCDCSDCEDAYEEIITGIKPEDSLDLYQRSMQSKRPKLSPSAATGPTSTANNITRCPYPNCEQPFSIETRESHFKLFHSSERFRDRIYPCTYESCQKIFRNPHHLKVHQRIHLGLRPFCCKWTGCGYDAAQKSDVIKHIRIRHFGLPKSQREQAERNIIDNRDPRDFMEIREEQL